MGKTSRNVNIMFSCAGRRVSLVNAFRAAAKSLKLNTKLFATETTRLSSALQVCDDSFIVKPVTHRDYISQLLKIVKDNRIKLLIPTVDLDLKVLAKSKERFARLGCTVLVSSPKVIDICQDKRKTYHFLSSNGFDTPVTISPEKALAKRKFDGPYFMKPWDGYASRGTAIVHNRRELKFYASKVPNPICQELISGTELTCDVYVGLDMLVKCVVPRKRIEVRSGEVSKAQVVKNAMVMDQAAAVVEKLGAGPGVITIQLFVTENENLKFIEINPRFGGGVPLSIKAGANFPRWILKELTCRKTNIKYNGFKDNLTMLRYDAEIWMQQ